MKKLHICIFIFCAITGQFSWALTTEEILKGAEERINANRKGEVTLKLLDEEGKPIPGNVEVRIEQTRHKFLFGSNIFKLNRCRLT